MIHLHDAGYDLATLVPGHENVLAIAGVHKVIAAPGNRYNPLFLYGPTSSGKTHLLYALCQRLARKYPVWNILCVPAGEFLDECEQAWQTQRTAEFREKLWKVDALLIDDVHQLANRPAALEELYHAFNRLVGTERQVVLTSRAPPADLLDFSQALRSRFQSGLVLGLESPREQLLRDIVVQKFRRSGIDPTRKATHFLCREIRTVREIDGLLHQIEQAWEDRIGKEPSERRRMARLSLAQVRSIFEKQSLPVLTLADIARAVCQHFHADLSKVRGASRQASLVQPRQLAMYLARELTAAPLAEIGAYFGGRDHTTVLYACRKVAEELRDNSFLAKAARELRLALRR